MTPEPQRRRPVLIPLDEASAPDPSVAPDVPDLATDALPAAVAAPPSATGRWRFGAWFLASAGALAGFWLTAAAWDFVTSLLDSQPVLGGIAAVLGAVAALSALAMVLRDITAWMRLTRIEHLRAGAMAALADGDTTEARAVADGVAGLFAGRADMAWALDRHRQQAGDILDAATLIEFTERELLAGPDQAARRVIETAARQVATVTAVVPLALADVLVALVANLRMVRQIAQIYGGRSGIVGSWRLVRHVMVHLAATGAVAAGDDLIHAVAGGGILSRLSRRFGEGVVNGALTARVGLAAMDVCRPLPFAALPRPRVTNLVARALRGLFGDGAEVQAPAAEGAKS